MMRNLVVLPLASSIPSARMSRPKTSAAVELDIAALVPELSDATSWAALEVEDVSMRSAWARCLVRKGVHWVQAWGWL